MENGLQKIDISYFKSLFPASLDAELGNDFFIATLNLDHRSPRISYPFRLDGYVAIVGMEGSLEVSINLKTFVVEKESFIVNVPGTIFHVSLRKDKNVRIFIAAMSPEFFSSVHLDFKKMFHDNISMFSSPGMKLTEKQIAFMTQYQKLVSELLSSEVRYKKEVLGSMVSSIFYIFGSLLSDRLSTARVPDVGTSSRSQQLAERFLNLVSEHHTRERGMKFYADMMCLTPKYLSRVVKEVSGRSASEWIDSFVVLEAKNMLRFSDMPIKKIVYLLNFKNESVFYRFFKTHTGYSPTEYRRL